MAPTTPASATSSARKTRTQKTLRLSLLSNPGNADSMNTGTSTSAAPATDDPMGSPEPTAPVTSPVSNKVVEMTITPTRPAQPTKRGAPDSDPSSDLSEAEDTESTDDDKDEDDDTSPDVPIMVSMTPAEPEIIDDEIIITSGTFPNVPFLPITILAYPTPGNLLIRSPKPVIDSTKYGLAHTTNLPYELRLWWSYYHKDHTTPVDNNLWAMVHVLSDNQKLAFNEVISNALSQYTNYCSVILGPGQSHFCLVRFKSITTKLRLIQHRDYLEYGVFVQISGPTRTSLLIFELDPITSLTPQMTSVLVGVSALPT